MMHQRYIIMAVILLSSSSTTTIVEGRVGSSKVRDPKQTSQPSQQDRIISAIEEEAHKIRDRETEQYNKQRIIDNLRREESHYRSEIQRMQQILTDLDKQHPTHKHPSGLLDDVDGLEF